LLARLLFCAVSCCMARLLPSPASIRNISSSRSLDSLRQYKDIKK
jgi:hypothetical protein